MLRYLDATTLSSRLVTPLSPSKRSRRKLRFRDWYPRLLLGNYRLFGEPKQIKPRKLFFLFPFFFISFSFFSVSLSRLSVRLENVRCHPVHVNLNFTLSRRSLNIQDELKFRHLHNGQSSVRNKQETETNFKLEV